MNSTKNSMSHTNTHTYVPDIVVIVIVIMYYVFRELNALLVHKAQQQSNQQTSA